MAALIAAARTEQVRLRCGIENTTSPGSRSVSARNSSR
jgi:hypothetical protein